MDQRPAHLRFHRKGQPHPARRQAERPSLFQRDVARRNQRSRHRGTARHAGRSHVESIAATAPEEQGVAKPVTLAWDGCGRLWTMSALEYPADANENRANAEALYARGK